MSNSDSIIQSRPENTSGQTANDATHTKSEKSHLDLNQENVEGVQQQAGKKKLGRKLPSLRKASTPSSSSQGHEKNQTADPYYPPAEFRSLVLEELKGNSLEWDISRVRIVSATFYRHSSGECSIRLGLKGELGRFNSSHVLTLHPPAPKVPTNKRRLLPKIPGTKSAKKVEGLSSPVHEKTNASDGLKPSAPQPDGDSNELLPNNAPSGTATPDCASAISGRTGFHSADSESLVVIPPQAQTAGPTEQARLLKSKSSTTKSTPSIHRLLSPDEPNNTSHGDGDVPTGAPNHCTVSTECPTARDGMNILPNAGSAKTASHVERNISPPTRPPNSFPQTYTPTALTQSNRDIATSAQASNGGLSNVAAPIDFPTDSSSAKPSDAALVRTNRRVSYLHTDDSALAPRSALPAQVSPKRRRADSMVPNSIDPNSTPAIGSYTLVTAPFKPQVPVKQQVTGIATGAFRVCARTVLDLKANVGAKPRTGCFHITDACETDGCPSPVQDNTMAKELIMGDKPITLEDVVVLASTIASRAARHTRAVHSEHWFLDAMWKGLHLITGSRQAYPDHPEGVDAVISELLDDVMLRFRGEITKIRREISQIREADDPRGERRQEMQTKMQQQIDQFNKEIDAKIKATDAIAKENRELELEKRRLQEMIQSEGKA
ncbi:hypothetical protein FRC06_001129 [Ceratobasidium sp. 370]|nr:hypothetical protein FRC06_001129 [Ceratobasidium sp. 370]